LESLAPLLPLFSARRSAGIGRAEARVSLALSYRGDHRPGHLGHARWTARTRLKRLNTSVKPAAYATVNGSGEYSPSSIGRRVAGEQRDQRYNLVRKCKPRPGDVRPGLSGHFRYQEITECPYFLSVLAESGVAGAVPVVFGVEVIAVLFGSVLLPESPKVTIPMTTAIAMAPIIHVVGLIVRSDVPGVGGTGRLFGLELS
jgi:hypothetical protein